jgi:hypothetical protein
LLGDGLGLGDEVEVGVGDGLGLLLSVPVLVGDGDALSDALDELSDGDGELESVALGLAESLGDELGLPEALALAESVAEAVELAECESRTLAAESSAAATVWVLAALVVFAAEAFFCE